MFPPNENKFCKLMNEAGDFREKITVLLQAGFYVVSKARLTCSCVDPTKTNV
jgi:hypothetical protein